MYRTPKSLKRHVKHNFAQIDSFLNATKMSNIIFGGDLNFPQQVVQWSVKLGENESQPNEAVLAIVGPTQEDEDDNNICKNRRSQAQILFNLTKTYGLRQFVTKPTNGANTLDLLYTNAIPCKEVSIVSSSPLSDHDVVSSMILTQPRSKVTAQVSGTQNSGLADIDLRNVDWNKCNCDLLNANIIPLPHDQTVPDCVKVLSEHLFGIIMKNGGLQRGKSRKPRRTVTHLKIVHRIKHLRKLLATKELGEDVVKQTLSELEKCNQALIDESKAKNSAEELEISQKIKSDPKVFYKYVRSFKKDKETIGPLEDDLGNLISDPGEMAEMFNKAFGKNFSPSESDNIKSLEPQFRQDLGKKDFLCQIQITSKDVSDSINSSNSNSSCGRDGISSFIAKKMKDSIAGILAEIFNKSLEDEQNIEHLYEANILPVFKKGLKSVALNYRPIARTSVVTKILERILVLKIQDHLNANGFVSNTQYGFSKNRSIQMQILRYTSFLMKKLKKDPEAAVATVHIDYAKAFQKISHFMLLKKLRQYKVSGLVGLWILRWLTERHMCTTIENCTSSYLKVSSGVPEGSVAGNELFKIMLIDIPTCDEDQNLLLLSFADDTHLSHVITDEHDVELFQDQLDNFYEWSNNNKLNFNNDKFQLITFQSKKSHTKHEPVLLDDNRNPISATEVVNHLGLLVDNQLSFTQEINKTLQKAQNRMFWILRTFSSRDPEILLPIFKSVVLSTIDFPNLVTVFPSASVISRLEDIQRRFTSKLDSMKLMSYQERLSKLNLMSIQRRKDRGLLMFMQRLSRLDPSIAGFPRRTDNRYLEENFHVAGHSYGGKNWASKKSWIDSIHSRSAHYIGVRLYNVLANSVKAGTPENAEKTFEQVKLITDRFLSNIPDRVSGRISENRLLTILRPWV